MFIQKFQFFKVLPLQNEIEQQELKLEESENFSENLICQYLKYLKDAKEDDVFDDVFHRGSEFFFFIKQKGNIEMIYIAKFY